MELLYLNQDEVIAAGGLDMKSTIQVVEEAFRLHAFEDDVLPMKTVLRWGGIETEATRGRINAMPAYVGGSFDVAGIKWIGGFPKNPFEYEDLPRATGIIILNDAHTGVPLAFMDGTLISAMRTGATTGVAAKYLAKRDTAIVGIIGAGVQARTQLMALNESLSIEQVKVYDLSENRSKEYAKQMKELLDLKIKVMGNAKECVHGSDVFVTVTTAHEPIVKNSWVKKGSLYAHVAGYEDEYAVARNSHKIVVDDWEQVKHRGASTLALMHNDGILEDKDIYAELGEIVTGEKAGRETDDERIYFSPVGMGTEDLTVAYRIYESAVKRGIGRRLKLWTRPRWV